MTRISLDLDDKLFEDFAILCIKKKKSKMFVLRELVKEWVERK